MVTSTNKPTISSARTLKTSLTSSLTKRKNTSLPSWWGVPTVCTLSLQLLVLNWLLGTAKWSATSNVSSMRLLVWKLVRFLVRLVTLPTSHHSLKNTSATNLVSVLKKSLHRCFLVIFTLSTLQFLRALQHLSSVWQLKFVVFKNRNNVKWKSSLRRGKKGLQQCLTNVTLSVLKIWQVLRVLSVVTW